MDNLSKGGIMKIFTNKQYDKMEKRIFELGVRAGMSRQKAQVNPEITWEDMLHRVRNGLPPPSQLPDSIKSVFGEYL